MKRSVKALISGLAGAALAASLLVAPAAPAVAKAPKNLPYPTTEPTRTWTWDNGWESDWVDRDYIGFTAGGRKCSSPTASQHTVSGGKLVLKVSKEADASVIAAQKAECIKSLKAKGQSKATKALGTKFQKGKASPMYRNAMLFTQGNFSMQTGTVAAKVKFPKDRGMHGGVWLQSVGGSEIDFIESYGYGKAVTSVVHTRYSNGKTKENKLYKKSQKKSWFDKFHEFAVTWDTSTVTFRIDGKVVKTKALKTSGDYFLVMSLLSSDWELTKLKDSKLNKASSQMQVDWVKAWVNS